MPVAKKKEPVLQKRRRQRCVFCKELKLDAMRRVNPYQADVYNNPVRQVICDECADALAEDI